MHRGRHFPVSVLDEGRLSIVFVIMRHRKDAFGGEGIRGGCIGGEEKPPLEREQHGEQHCQRRAQRTGPDVKFVDTVHAANILAGSAKIQAK